MKKEQHTVNWVDIIVELQSSYSFGNWFRFFVEKGMRYWHKKWDFTSNYDKTTVVWKWYIKETWFSRFFLNNF